MTCCYNPIHWCMNFEVNLLLLFLWLSVPLPRKTSCMSNTASILLSQGLYIFFPSDQYAFFFLIICVSQTITSFSILYSNITLHEMSFLTILNKHPTKTRYSPHLSSLFLIVYIIILCFLLLCWVICLLLCLCRNIYSMRAGSLFHLLLFPIIRIVPRVHWCWKAVNY